MKKHLALHHGRFLPIHNKIVLGSDKFTIIGSGVGAPVLLENKLSKLMGGLLISDVKGNVLKGGKINRVAPKPIRFLV